MTFVTITSKSSILRDVSVGRDGVVVGEADEVVPVPGVTVSEASLGFNQSRIIDDVGEWLRRGMLAERRKSEDGQEGREVRRKRLVFGALDLVACWRVLDACLLRADMRPLRVGSGIHNIGRYEISVL